MIRTKAKRAIMANLTPLERYWCRDHRIWHTECHHLGHSLHSWLSAKRYPLIDNCKRLEVFEP